MRKRNKLILAAVLTVVLALAVAVPAFAATETAPAAPTDTATCGLGQGGMRGFGAGGQMSVAVSELLGMEPADLQAARQDGQSLAEIAESKGIDTATLISGMLEVRKTALTKAVAEGRITQAQADLMLKNMGDRIADRIDDTQVGPPAGRGGHGRGGQGGYGACMGSAQ